MFTVACPCCKKPERVTDDSKVTCSRCKTSYIIENKSSRWDEVDDLGKHDRSYVIPLESSRDMQRRREAMMAEQGRRR